MDQIARAGRNEKLSLCSELIRCVLRARHNTNRLQPIKRNFRWSRLHNRESRRRDNPNASAVGRVQVCFFVCGCAYLSPSHIETIRKLARARNELLTLASAFDAISEDERGFLSPLFFRFCPETWVISEDTPFDQLERSTFLILINGEINYLFCLQFVFLALLFLFSVPLYFANVYCTIRTFGKLQTGVRAKFRRRSSLLPVGSRPFIDKTCALSILASAKRAIALLVLFFISVSICLSDYC